jgi:hypothetical protein
MWNWFFDKEGKNKSNDYHLNKWIYKDPQKSKKCVFISCGQLFVSHAKKQFKEML